MWVECTDFSNRAVAWLTHLIMVDVHFLAQMVLAVGLVAAVWFLLSGSKPAPAVIPVRERRSRRR
jgi:hypothetical protein